MGDDASRNLLPYSSNDFLLPSFVEQVDDFSDLISGEIDYPSLDCGFVGGSNNNTVSCGEGDMFHVGGCNDDSNSILMDGILNQLDEGAKNGEDDDEDDDDDNQSSSATTTTLSTPTKKKTSNKVDRSTTLISERRRRGRMKEKLYALRSLVPNITKMDKASIVGDAVLYVQDLQTQAKKLKEEIAGLEASLSGAKRHQQQDEEEDQGETPENRPNKRTQHVSNPKHHTTTSRKILKMDVFQVEEGGFYTRLVCSRGVGVAVSLYKALESLTTFNVETSNLASASPDRFVLTFSLTIKEGEQGGMNLASMKLWITAALLTQGFELGISS